MIGIKRQGLKIKPLRLGDTPAAMMVHGLAAYILRIHAACPSADMELSGREEQAVNDWRLQPQMAELSPRENSGPICVRPEDASPVADVSCLADVRLISARPR